MTTSAGFRKSKKLGRKVPFIGFDGGLVPFSPTLTTTQPQNQGPKGACFVADTPILMSGGTKYIQDLKAGDEILSRSESDPDGPVEAKRVREVFVTEGRIVGLHVGGRVIRTTAEHPFWVKYRGWTDACKIQVNDCVVSHDGQWLAVTDVFDTGERETVYNVRIADFHTYFVGRDEWGFSVWAHNKCWYHGTDSASAASILAIGPNPVAFMASNPVDPSGLFFTPDPVYALDSAMRATSQRNFFNRPRPNPPLTPVVLEVDDADIGSYLVNPPNPFPPGSPEDGEKILPVASFGMVLASAFHIWIPSGP